MRLLYLDIDTLRPDHLGCYGYHRNTSPNLDRLAAEGVRFDNCHTTDAPCLPSRSALMTGTFGIHNGVIDHGGFNADFRPQGASRNFRSQMSYNTLPAFLKYMANLYTAYIGGFGERHSSFAYYAGFREIYDTGKCGHESAENVTPAALRWLDTHGHEDNWYLHVNYWDPHTPYRAPESFGNPFKDEPIPEWITPELLDFQQKHLVGPHGILDIAMFDDSENPKYPRQPGKVLNMDDARRVFDGYDCGVRYADMHIGSILQKLDVLGILDDTAIIVSSDHGECIGELGMWSEHGTADSATCRIPLIIRWPGMRAGHIDSGLHYNIDLLPTIAELLNKPSRKSWEGTSFATAITDAGFAGRDYLVLSQCAHGCQRSVRWDDWLYIRTYHDFFHLFPREMLFNLVNDPHEQDNLAPQRPDICAEAVHHYLDWHDDMMATQPEGFYHDPLWEVIHRSGAPYHAKGHLKEYCERLENSGRGWAVPLLKQEHQEEFR